jgi:hypothetical protein
MSYYTCSPILFRESFKIKVIMLISITYTVILAVINWSELELIQRILCHINATTKSYI